MQLKLWPNTVGRRDCALIRLMMSTSEPHLMDCHGQPPELFGDHVASNLVSGLQSYPKLQVFGSLCL